MSYSISSGRFQHPLLKPLLEKLTEYFTKEGICFYVIGATARDIVMQIHNQKSGRATYDLDIAVAISNWEEYQKVEDGITNIEGFKKDTDQKQRFIYLNDFQLDIIPFGNVMKEDEKIFWPPEEDIAMSILGFSEVNKHTLPVKIDDELEVQVASLAGVFILKTVAWTERHMQGNKDADDLAFIITNYLTIYEKRAIEKYYDFIYVVDDFDTFTAGSKLLGLDIANLLSDNNSALEKITSIIKLELKKEEESKLMNQIIETHRSLTFDSIYDCLENILKGIEH